VVQPVKNVIVWRWDLNNTTFGEHAPNANPDGDSLSYTLNLRYPGQYADAESGMSYNYFRDYDPATGRYVESDPIGLGGGSSTYAYAIGQPLRDVDALGLWSTSAHNYLLEEFARRNGIGSVLLSELQDGSATADSFFHNGYPGYQGATYSFMHAMTSSAWPDKKEACRMAGIFTDNQYSKYKSESGDVNSPTQAWFDLGMGLHTIMDNTSPAHRGFQFWDGDGQRHGPGLLGTRRKTIEDLPALMANPKLLEHTLNAMQSYYVSGQGINCGCYK
jgi:RHS repeat-associated protein